MIPRILENLFTVLTLVDNSLPPRDPSDEDDEDDEDDDEEDDSEDDAVIREPDTDE